MINPKNLVKHELIGLKVTVSESKNPSLIGISGEVVNETKNTLVIQTSTGEKAVIKDQCVFVFILPEHEKVRVEGRLLVSRPEDRIKKRFKAW
jgi:ribonuclease P protein subunit POP4